MMPVFASISTLFIFTQGKEFGKSFQKTLWARWFGVAHHPELVEGFDPAASGYHLFINTDE